MTVLMDDGPVRDAIARLYQAYAKYPPPLALHGSPLRDVGAILGALQSAPLRDLQADQLLPYAGWAITTVGDPDDYRHFLPRIVELALDNPGRLGAEPVIIAGRLDYAGWGNQPAEEFAAVRAAFLAAWIAGLALDRMDYEPNDWLLGLAALGNIAGALDAWIGSPSPHAIEHLAAFVSSQQDALSRQDIIDGPYWDDVAPAVRQEITAWLRQPDAWQWLAAASPSGGPCSIGSFADARRVLHREGGPL